MHSSLKKRAEIKVGRYPEDVVISTDGATAYVADWFSDAISIIDLVQNRQTRQIRRRRGPARSCHGAVIYFLGSADGSGGTALRIGGRDLR